MLRLVMLGCLVVLACGGCGDSSADQRAVEADRPTSTVSTQPEQPPPIRIAFDGEDCTSPSPGSIAPGSRSVVLTDASGRPDVDFVVFRFAEGYGWEDHVQRWSGYFAGGPLPGFPDWLTLGMHDFTLPRLELGANEMQYNYVFEPGTYGVNTITDRPSGYWLCGPIEVIDE